MVFKSYLHIIREDIYHTRIRIPIRILIRLQMYSCTGNDAGERRDTRRGTATSGRRIGGLGRRTALAPAVTAATAPAGANARSSARRPNPTAAARAAQRTAGAERRKTGSPHYPSAPTAAGRNPSAPLNLTAISPRKPAKPGGSEGEPRRQELTSKPATKPGTLTPDQTA
jgi:hypothetical protein